MIVRFLREDEKLRFFNFAQTLPDRDFWGKKGRYLRGDFERFQKFWDYIKPFHPKFFLVAEENNRFVGFAVAVYNPDWIKELEERYGCTVEKRAYFLGIGVIQRRKDVLKAVIDEMTNRLSQKKMESAEYPTLGNICLTTATDILTPENVDSLILFREVGFRISECYYTMKLDLDIFKHNSRYSLKGKTFRFKERSIEVLERNDVLGSITWDPVENGRTSIGIYVTPAQRGEGLGTLLMAEALQQLKTREVKVVELGVDGNNLPALKLYRNFGFTVHRAHFYILVPCMHSC